MMSSKALNKLSLSLLLIFAVSLIMFALTVAIEAFFSKTDIKNIGTVIDVNSLFGKLETPDDPNADWGTEGNPFLIYENEHLANLYSLQNSKDIKAINENTVFQISDIYGKPCFVGSDPSDPLKDSFSIPSIGSEDFPFISTLKGVASDTDSVILPTGESTNTSAIYGVTIEAYEGQIDIGLFGKVGKQESGSNYGLIENLLLADISLTTISLGGLKPEHLNYHTENNHETNHIGILAGHAENCTIKNISVYYSSQSAAAAFNIKSSSTAKYTTAGGIIGFYENLIVSDDDLPVNSDAKGEGGSDVGTGLGIMFSGDIWDILQQSNPELTEDSYDIQDNFDDNLYGTNIDEKNYFQIGVFTFIHSNQYNRNDKIIKLWTTENDNIFTVSNSNNYTQTETKDFAAQKFECIKITDSNYSTYSSFNNNYRFMIVATDSSDSNAKYALMKSSRNAVTQKIDIYTDNGDNYVNFPVINGQSTLYNYTFQVCRTRTDTYENDADGFRIYEYETDNYDAGKLPAVSTSSDSSIYAYFCYGETDIRPLRIYDTISFANSSSAGSYPEYVRVVTNSTSSYENFRFNRGGSTSIFLRLYNNWLNYTPAAGFSPLYVSNDSAYSFEIYAVDTSASEETDSRLLYSPSDSDYTAYDMSKTVLFYEGSPDSSTQSEKYKYQLIEIESLNWVKNDGNPLKSVDTSLLMGDSTMYYYTNGVYFGTETVPVGDSTNQIAPRGSVAFRVQSSPGVTTADINIIVATDPTQLINQTINCSYFNPGTTLAKSFVLPSVPGNTHATTTPIYVRDNDQSPYRTAYPNFNTLLVAYTIEVTPGRTYFLEASSGSVSFVYFSVASTASRDRNDKHITDLAFNPLKGIDYVYTISNNIITVNSTSYIQSLVMPYFGMKNDIAGGGTETEPVINILSCYDLEYNIYRCNVVPEGAQIYINVFTDSPLTIELVMDLMNINFATVSYLDLEQKQRVYSDEVIIYINNTLLDWEAYYSSS